MQIAKYRNIIVMLVMMAFTSQVMASMVISCQSQSTPSQSREHVIDSVVIDHSQHMMSLTIPATDNDAGSVCCLGCDCSLGGCSATAVLPSGQHLFISDIGILTNHYNELVHGQLIVSLFRPPISR